MILLVGSPYLLQASVAQTTKSEALAQQAFAAIVSAQQAGANVTVLISQFNLGLQLQQTGNYTQASSTFSAIISQAGQLKSQAIGHSESSMLLVYLLVPTVSFAIATSSYFVMVWMRRIRVRRILQMQIQEAKENETD